MEMFSQPRQKKNINALYRKFDIVARYAIYYFAQKEQHEYQMASNCFFFPNSLTLMFKFNNDLHFALLKKN